MSCPILPSAPLKVSGESLASLPRTPVIVWTMTIALFLLRRTETVYVFNTDQVSQFTSSASPVRAHRRARTALDGRMRPTDGRRFIERLWGSLEHEDACPKDYADSLGWHRVASTDPSRIGRSRSMGGLALPCHPSSNRRVTYRGRPDGFVGGCVLRLTLKMIFFPDFFRQSLPDLRSVRFCC